LNDARTATQEDYLDPVVGRDRVEWVGAEQQQVGPLAHLDRAAIGREAECHGVVERRRAQDLRKRTAPYQIFTRWSGGM
jgi:hypothetical protein